MNMKTRSVLSCLLVSALSMVAVEELCKDGLSKFLMSPIHTQFKKL
jgi:hypothetical protein